MDMSGIVRKLHALKRRMKAAALVRGAGAWLVWLSLVVLFLFASDYFLILPAGARIVLLCFGALTAAMVLRRKVIAPMTARLTDDDVALAIERTYPELEEKLISAVQLSRRTAPEFSVIQSGEMVEKTSEEAVRALDGLRLGPVVKLKPALKAFAAGIAAAGILAAAGAAEPELASIWMDRALGGGANWPQRTELAILEPSSADSTVGRGENFAVKVRVGGEIPSRVRVLFDFPGSGEEGEADLVRLDASTFQYFFTNVVSDLSFRVRAGDAETGVCKVRVLVPPKVADVRARLLYPEHTKILGRPEGEWDLADGNVKAPVGTAVILDAGSTRPLKSAFIRFGKKGMPDLEMALLDGARIRASFEVSADTSYSINLVGAEGLTNKVPSRYSIKAIPDQAPLITLSWPRFNEQVTDQAVLPVKGTLKDDYGLASARILMRRAGEKPETAAAAGLDVPSGGFGEKEVRFEREIEVPSLRLPGPSGAEPLKEGDVFLLRVEAADFRPSPSPNVTTTREVQIEIVSRAELERTIESRMIAIRDKLAKIRSSQETAMDRMTALRDALDEEQVWSRSDVESLLGCEVAQRRVSTDSERARDDFLSVIDSVVNNKLGDPDYVKTLREMAEMIDLAAGEKSQAALKSIEKARLASARSDQAQASADAIEGQAQVVRILTDILDRMRKWEDESELIREFRELRDAEKKINERTAALLKEGKEGKKDGR